MAGSSQTTATGGYRVTWEGDIRTRPDAGDAMAHLRRGLRVLRDHPEVAEATCRYRRRESRVEFAVRIGHALAPDFAMVRTAAALRESLERAGFGVPDPPRGSVPPMAIVRLDRGPVAVRLS